MEQQALQLHHYLKLLWRGKWIILLTTMIALGGVVIFTWNEAPPTPSFQATATVVVEPVAAPTGLGALPPSITSPSSGLGITSGDTSLNTRIQIITSRNVMERALQKLQPEGQAFTPGVTALQVEALQSSISVQPIPNTNFLQIRARASSPDAAEQRANAVVEAYIDYVKADRTRAIQDALDQVQNEIQSSNQTGDVGARALDLLPGVAEELVVIARSVEDSAQKLEGLRTQEQTNESTQSLLNLEVPEVQRTVKDLDSIAQDLQRIRQDIDGVRPQAPTGTQSPLSAEAARMERAAQDLGIIGQEIRVVNRDLSGTSPNQAFTNMAGQVDNIRTALEGVPRELDRVQANSVGISQEIVSIREYVNSVNDDLRTIAQQLRAAASGSGLIDQERVRLEGKVGSYRVSLSATRDDLKDIRESDTFLARDYRYIVSAEGIIATSVQQFDDLATQLNNASDTRSVQEEITQALHWIEDSQKTLANLSGDLRGLEELESEGQQAEVLSFQISGEIDNVALILATAATKLRDVQPKVTDPLKAAQLRSIVTRLDAAQTSTSGSSARLSGVSQGSTSTLADRVGVVQSRIQESSESLWATLENIEVATHLPSTVLENEAASQAYADTEDISRSLVIASRQLQGLRGLNTDPLVDGELSTVGDRLVAAQANVQAISTRLSTVVEDPRNGTPSELATNQLRLETVSRILRSAATVHVDLSSSSETIDQNIVTRIREQIEIGTAIIARVAQEMARLQSTEADALRYAQMVVLEQNLRDAEMQTSDIAAQLQQLQGGRGPQYLQLRQLEQQLELALLQPQDTGIAIVDSAVLPQATGRSTIFSRLRIPLAGLAGLFLGSIGVLVKAQVDRTIRSTWQIREQLGLTNLGVVPKTKVAKAQLPKLNDVGLADFSEALQLVGTGLSGPISRGTRSFLITSAEAEEGKTTLTVNLARVLAQYGRRILLVDANLRKPEIARILGLSENSGLAEALEDQRNPLDYVLDGGGFAVLPGGTPPSNPVELLSSPAMTLFLQQAQQRYDLVLIDSPPAVGFAETKAMAKGAGGVILVIKGGSTSIDAVKETGDEMEAVGVTVVGVVFNFAPAEECAHLRHEKYGVGT